MGEAKSPIFGTKVDFFPIRTFQIPNVPNFKKFIWSKLHIKRKIIKIGGPFLTTKTRIFGTKVDFFPIGTFRIQNFPNFNKFIWSKLHLLKKIIKIGGPVLGSKKI